jgi:hypothetical protein
MGQSTLGLGAVDSAVPGLHAEQQFVGLRATFGVETNPGPVRRRSPPPQGDVGSSQRAEEIE